MTAPDPRIRVLICEDSDDDALLIATHLRRGGLDVDYERAETAEQVAEALSQRTPDLVISDYHMPGFGAEHALELLRDSGHDLPFILVSGAIGEEQAANMMRAGAHDYVLKDRMIRLVPVIRRELRQARDRRERRALQQQLRQAERLDSLGRLAGGIAHDFNNLLAVILGHTDLTLAELAHDDPHRVGMERIRELAERGAALTRHLLVFSRQETLHPETLDANEVVADTERVLSGAIGEDVEFSTLLAPGLWPISIDRSELERLLLNLVSNSRRAMPHGGALTVQTANILGDGLATPMVRIAVTDTGTGMSEEVQGHAFEPFYTTDTGTGTGLGLSTAYGVVKAAGGEITLDSRPGRGTTVRIDLPAHRATALERDIPRTPPERGHGQTILVVEDDDAVRDLVGLMVRRGGYRAVCLARPDAALDVIHWAEQPIDALITDMIMPAMTGIELATAARVHLPGLPVLLMSGYTAGSLPEADAMPEGVALIRKPFTADALLHSVADILAGRVRGTHGT